MDKTMKTGLNVYNAKLINNGYESSESIEVDKKKRMECAIIFQVYLFAR